MFNTDSNLNITPGSGSRPCFNNSVTKHKLIYSITILSLIGNWLLMSPVVPKVPQRKVDIKSLLFVRRREYQHNI